MGCRGELQSLRRHADHLMPFPGYRFQSPEKDKEVLWKFAT